jgi:two-component system nitrogen regulation sensor histidine kinase NtrY
LKNKYSSDLDKKNKENFQENLKIINNQIKQIEKLVNEFSDFARMPKPIFQKNDLIILIKDNIKLLQELDQTIKIDFIHNNQQLFFDSDKEQLSRVFLNLIKNSIESIQQKIEKVNDFNKNITIELNDFDSHISFVINDNGIGFKNLNNNIKEILNPYFTTKKDGTGLGLSIVNKIVNDHNGNIEFISKDDGAIIKIIFLK